MPTETPTSVPDDDLDGCPMCGHLFVADDGRCTNCGEELVEVEPPEPAVDERPRSIFNWRFGLGLFLFLTFTTLTVAEVIHIPEVRYRDRTFHQLLAVALGCAAVIGLVLLIQGIIQAVTGKRVRE